MTANPVRVTPLRAAVVESLEEAAGLNRAETCGPGCVQVIIVRHDLAHHDRWITPSASVYEINGHQVDFRDLAIGAAGKKWDHLTPREARILRGLVAQSGEIVTMDTLRHAWSEDAREAASPAAATTIRRHIWTLREKLGSSAIETIQNVGYRVWAKEISQP